MTSRLYIDAELTPGNPVALPDGLIVPKVRNADRKGMLQIGREAREVSE